jgi:hypothetical protein
VDRGAGVAAPDTALELHGAHRAAGPDSQMPLKSAKEQT